MGLIQAFTGAIGGTFADQWKDYIVPAPGIKATSVVFPGVAKGTDAGRGSNYKGSENVISNGSKILVPEGTAMVTIQDGEITNIAAQPGGYIYDSKDQNSKSIFAGEGLVDSLIKTSWDRFKFGGVPAAQQMVFYVNLKEIPGNKFGTQSEIYWFDNFLGTQVGALTRGTYTIKVIDPVILLKNFVPVSYLRENAIFDLGDIDNPLGEQLFNEVVGSLSGAFSQYVNDPNKNNTIMRIQSDQVGFAKALSEVVENDYQWRSDRGLEIVKSAILSIEYDADTRELLSDVKKADALMGARGNSFLQQSAARGIQSAGENNGGVGIGMMGMGMNAAGGMLGGLQQPVQPQQNMQSQQPVQENQTQPQEDPTEKLLKMKKLLDAEAITQEEYDNIKKQILNNI